MIENDFLDRIAKGVLIVGFIFCGIMFIIYPIMIPILLIGLFIAYLIGGIGENL
jgi:hypothetical protein